MMFRAAFGYKRFFSLVIVLTFVVFLFSPELQKKPVQLIGRPVGIVVYYLQAGLFFALSGVESIWFGYVDLIHVRRDSLRLQSENEELRGENNRLREEGEEAARLRALLDFKKESSHRLIAARVIGRELSRWYDTIMIDQGEQAGVAVDMGVVMPSGVVGKVVKTGPHFAQVLLITDHNSAVAAIDQRTRDEGIVEGIEKGRVKVKYLPHFSDIQPNDVMVTSGLEGSFPKGLLIGKVDRVERRERELFLHVEVTPGVDLSKLEEVLVVANRTEN